MTIEELDKVRFSVASHHIKTDKFLIIHTTSCNCRPAITLVIYYRVKDGKELPRSCRTGYICGGIYYKNRKVLLEECKEEFEFYNDDFLKWDV